MPSKMNVMTKQISTEQCQLSANCAKVVNARRDRNKDVGPSTLKICAFQRGHGPIRRTVPEGEISEIEEVDKGRRVKYADGGSSE
jgi:hypothetical protein